MLLVCGKQKLELSEAQAQSILQIQKAMGKAGTKWELPNNSPYQFKENALIKRADTKDCTGSEKPKRNSPGSKAPRKASLPRGNDSE